MPSMTITRNFNFYHLEMLPSIIKVRNNCRCKNTNHRVRNKVIKKIENNLQESCKEEYYIVRDGWHKKLSSLY